MAIAASEDLERLVHREHANPHGVLGAHPTKGGAVVRAFRPAAASVKVVTADGETAELEQVHDRHRKRAGRVRDSALGVNDLVVRAVALASDPARRTTRARGARHADLERRRRRRQPL